MNILGWLLYVKALLYLLTPVGSMGMWGRLCGAQLADMVAFVCEGRGYYVGETDSPILSERQAKAFTNGGRKRTGKIVTECCDNLCNLQIIESYCAPLPEGQERGPVKHWWLHEREQETISEQNNRVEPPIEEELIVDEDTAPEVTQEIIDTLSDQEDLEDSIESETNILNIDAALLMLADQALETSEQRLVAGNEDELLQKEKEKAVTDMNDLETHDDVIDEVSETSDRNQLNKTKGNTRTNRPSSKEKNSRRKNSRERKRNKTKSGASRERKARRRNKSKNKKNRRRKPKHEHDDYTQPTDQLITDIEVLHPQVQVNAEPPSRSEPGTVDEAVDPGSRSERSFLTTITAKLLDVMGLQQNSNTNVR